MSAACTILVMHKAGVVLEMSALTATHEMHAMLAHLATLNPDARHEIRPPNVLAHAHGQPQDPTIPGAQPLVARSPGQARALNNGPRVRRRRPSKPPLEKTMAGFACPS
jgi:hypothetical protein